MKKKISTGRDSNASGRHIYCSGPLFCPGEMGEMLALSRRIEEFGYDTFLPQRDGIEALVMGMIDSPLNVNVLNIRKALDRAIFSLDIYQIIERCDVLVLNMNGRVPDEGALVEASVAWATGKPLVIYKDDARTAFKGMDNSMVSGLAYTKKVNSIVKVPEAIEKVLSRVSSLGAAAYKENMPPAVKSAVELGRKIWLILGRRDTSRKKTDTLIAEIADLCG